MPGGRSPRRKRAEPDTGPRSSRGAPFRAAARLPAFWVARDIPFGLRKGDPKVKGKISRLFFPGPGRTPAVLDVCRDLPQENPRTRVNPGLLPQLTLRRASQ